MRSRHYAWLLVGLLWLVAFLNYVDRQVIYSLFPLLERDLGLSGSQLGFLSSLFLWTYGLASPFGGYIADRFGRVRVILLSLLIWSLATWATSQAGSYTQLAAARALMGLSEAFYLPAALALIADYHAERTRALASGLHQSGLYAGIIVGGAGGGWLGEHLGWRTPFLWLGLAGIAYFLVLAVALRGSARSAPPATAPALRQAFAQLAALPGYRRVTAVFGAVGLANWLVYTWLPSYLYERFHLSLAAAGFSATFYIQAASFAGILLGGLAADHWAVRYQRGRVLVQGLGLAAAAPFLFLMALAGSQPLLVTALLVYGLGRGIYDANTMPVLCQLAPPQLRSTGYGLFNLVSCLVGGLTAAGAGWLKSWLGLSPAFQAAAFILLAAALLLISLPAAVLRGNAATAGSPDGKPLTSAGG